MLDFPVDMYLTGSNSKLLSSEISSLLTGRFIHFTMQVLTYSEMLAFREGMSEAREDLLWLYIRRGGFPAIHLSPDFDERSSYMVLNSIFDSIVLRDVVQRYKIRDVELLRRILYFIADGGSPVSAKYRRLFQESGPRGHEYDHTYLDALVSSYIITRSNATTSREERFLKLRKILPADSAFSTPCSGTDRHISGFENIVHNELVSRGYKHVCRQARCLESRFHRREGQQKVYVQVVSP